ncbi:MAG: biotin--protein ligase, partial [Actinomyces succiniciruminis]|nr:biotin--protein ligase [Actinomyces succiniciruminis]MBM6979589.1 biotin--protein ligase [Actinomyces succiniciruminis]
MTARSPFSRLVVVERTGSTNTDLRRALTGPDGALDPAAAAAWPHLSALRALTQTAGRGRADHTWTTPPTGALTASIVVRPLVPAASLAWLPLLA